MKLSHADFSEDQIQIGLEDILRGTDLMSVSLTDTKGIHSFTAYFAYNEEFNLFFVSDPATRHGRAIRDATTVAISIFLTPTTWGEGLQGIQAEGQARLLATSQADDALKIYGARFPKFGASFQTINDLVSHGSPSRPYGIYFTELHITNEQRFGRRKIVSLKLPSHSLFKR